MGGYFLGYPDMGVPPPKLLILGKSTENNADIFAAFNLLAAIDNANTATWAARANVAGDFVVSMFDSTKGRFNAGTVTQDDASQPGPGVCPDLSLAKGNDVLNTCDFLDSNTFTAFGMAGSAEYASRIDWTKPAEYVLSTFAQTITSDGLVFQGFDIVPAPVSGNNGVAWEFTGQSVEACKYLDFLLGASTFQPCADMYSGQIAQAQTSAPFEDGLGVVASTLDGENQPPNNLPPVNECLNTPFQCIPERAGLAASSWAIFADQGVNPMTPSPVPVCMFTLSPAALYFQSNGGSAFLNLTATNQQCAWLATTNATSVTLNPNSGVGSQTLDVSALPNNSGYEQFETVMIGGQVAQITQWITDQIFQDVPPSSYFFDGANLLYGKGITSGCAPSYYCPDDSVTRAEMAIFIVRTVVGTGTFTYSQTPHFADVQPTDFGFAYIQKFFELGITTGCAPGLYCPNDSITRAQMAVFIIRARYGAQTVFDFTTAQYFTDVPPTGFACNYIQRMKEDNITSGCTPTTYCPDNPVNRGEMAVFIMRGGFNQLLPSTEPIITSITPTTISNGIPATLTIIGQQTNFIAGSTMVNAVPGLIVDTNSLVVVSPTMLTVSVTANSSTTPQPLSIWVTDQTEEAVLPNGLTVH